LQLTPCEFVDHAVRDASHRARSGAGETALARLRSTIRFYKDRAAVFVRLEDMLPQDDLTIEVLDQVNATRAVA